MSYIDIVDKKLEAMRDRDDVIILAIESSCDETAVAVSCGRKILSNVIASQIEIHRRFGGVVPEIASRNHTAAIDSVTKEALAQAGKTLDEVDCIAVTCGAGLLGALIVGVSYAKALAYATCKPLIAVNHIKGHIAANYIDNPDLKPPYICLIASGGHTAIALVKSWSEIEIEGATQDDACGEAFDKVARVLGLPYPGGPQIEKLARQGRPTVALPTPYKDKNTYDFSFSGLKTAVINYVHRLEQNGETLNAADLACSFEEKATDILVDNTLRCAVDSKVDTVVIAGGVSANAVLREKMKSRAREHGVKVYFPSLKLCTDNGAMIASEAYNMIKTGARSSDLDLDANANLKVWE